MLNGEIVERFFEGGISYAFLILSVDGVEAFLPDVVLEGVALRVEEA